MARGDGAHRDVILLVGAGRDRIGGRWVGEHLVLGGEGGRGVLVDHHPGLDPRRRSKERRQAAVEPGIDEQRGPAFADGAQLGDGQLREVERERDRLAMEVASADDTTAAGGHRVNVRDAAAREDERVVGGRVELDVEHPPEVVEGVLHRAVDLRHAAQRVRVLDLVGMAVMAALDARVAQQVAELPGHRDLAGMRASQLVGGGEGHVRAQQRLDGLGGRHTRGPHQAVGVGQEQGADRRHHLGPVQQGQAFLGLQRQRLQTGLPEGQQTRDDLATELHLAAPDERQRQVRQRREIARGAEAPLFGHDRMDAEAQEVEQAVDDQRTAAAVAEGQRVGAQEQHRPHDLARERRADAGRVAHQQVLLEETGLFGGDERGGEVTEAGRDAVDHGTLGDQRFDDVARLLHPGAGVSVELHRLSRTGHGLDVGDGQVGSGQHDAIRAVPATVRVEVRDLRLTHRPEDSRLSSTAPVTPRTDGCTRGPLARLHRRDRPPVPRRPVWRRRVHRGHAGDGHRIRRWCPSPRS